MTNLQSERPPASTGEPSQSNRRQAAETAFDSSADQRHSGEITDPYADLPHPADAFSPDEARDLHAIRVREELSRMVVREEAREQLAARRSASTIASIAAPIALHEFLAIPDEPTKYRIDGLFPVGGRIMLSAQFKAGKTTAVGNLIRSLVDGEPFLGRFATESLERVTLLDNELDERTLRGWLRDQGIQNPERVRVLSMRGKVGTFNILDDRIRERWAEVLTGTNFLILDVLRPVLDALGLDENRDAGRFLVAFDTLLADAGIAEAAVIHHMGHNGERSRGDSRLQDWPDALWRLVRQNEEPNSPRYFSAFGRDVDVAEGLLTYDVRNRNLTYASGNRKDAAATAALPDILDHLAAHAGQSGNQIEKALAEIHPQKAIRAGIQAGIRDGSIRTAKGPKNANLHYLDQVGGMLKESSTAA
ncbi:AAA family ATPase [Prescottella equi]|uniref:AAA family ATPase n=1 Tax=Rhodococcus hoagii TaxID=43767 RepID=UPI00111C38E6|nr:AAA family ATPase [Prescottella equi]